MSFLFGESPDEVKPIAAPSQEDTDKLVAEKEDIKKLSLERYLYAQAGRGANQLKGSAGNSIITTGLKP